MVFQSWPSTSECGPRGEAAVCSLIHLQLKPAETLKWSMQVDQCGASPGLCPSPSFFLCIIPRPNPSLQLLENMCSQIHLKTKTSSLQLPANFSILRVLVLTSICCRQGLWSPLLTNWHQSFLGILLFQSLILQECWDYSHVRPASCFLWVLGIQTQALMVVWPVLCPHGGHFVMISLTL